ncbi:MAG: LrgB family protein [Alphaproteobacteria bacterium]|jgi:predicted murein hydrolase (TIGR00659 family)|uniref:LrgB family protein n=1 Tax=Pacificispira sp. TaxID=2888761 RepID=UPI001B17F906|nr:LrgB family protein [Alphaproteobacteria bacterium]MBO6861621.1 LrgB family protein [Alphaproteobacteria bacterium]
MIGATQDIWVYLAETPLLWLTATLIAYGIGHAAFTRSGSNPAVNPVAIAAALLIALLVATDTDYDTYFEGAQFVHFLLGPATVALAVPLYTHLPRVRRAALPMLAALVAGVVTAVGTALAVASLLGADSESLLSLAPKSVTSPIAMGIAERIGGLPSLAAGLVIATGIVGAIVVTPLLNLMRVRDWRARGFAVGIAAHGIGTARAFQVNPIAGVFAAVAMGLNGLTTALLVPLIAHLLL